MSLGRQEWFGIRTPGQIRPDINTTRSQGLVASTIQFRHVRIMKHVFRTFFILEIVVILLVITTFKLVPTRIMAGAIAGSFFVVLGAWIFFSGLRDRQVLKSASFVMGTIHLFVVALPMMITRFLNASSAFTDIQILGLPGPLFHRLSTAVYFALMMATIFDWIRARKS